MKNSLTYLRNKHDYFFKVSLFFISTLCLVYLFPKEAKFKFEFQKGKPWLHNDLIAPFDFAIQKPVQEISTEKEILKGKTKLYFKTDPTVIKHQSDNFTQNFEKKWKEKNNSNNAKSSNLEFGLEIIKAIYSKGVVKVDEIIEGKPKDFEIVVVNNNKGIEREFGELYTLQTAYDFVNLSCKENKTVDCELLAGLIENSLYHNVFYDSETTKKILDDKLESISTSKGIVLANEKIISKGEVVNDELFQKLVSLKSEYEKHYLGTANNILIALGQFILISLLLTTLGVYLYSFRKELVAENKKIIFILLTVLSMVYLSQIPKLIPELNIYVIPFCVLPIILRTFYDIRLALFTHIITIILISFLAPNSFEFILIQFTAGVVSVYGFVNLRKRAQIFTTSFYLFLTYSVTYLGISLMQEGKLSEINYSVFLWFGGNAMLTLFAYPLMYLFEKTFGFLSDVTLIELSDMNNPLLRKLAEKAPGTFQHSLQVANLAEEVVHQIGGNSLLVRTGALYHDVGKINNPLFFIENQQNFNPHEEISFEESAKVIIDHVIHGVEIAKQYGLPEQIIDFIRTHHGTTMTRYFFISVKKQNPDLEIDESKYKYPGPIPHSKEAAILMMADAVEASSRSLKKYDSITINDLVENIIESQAKENQFVNSNITYKDITEAKKIFKKKLQNIYHLRIEYPKESN